MKNELERKTWTAAGSWLGRTLSNSESVDAETLASTAAAAGFSREQLNQAASEIGAEPLRKPVGRWRLEYSRRDYWQSFTDGYSAATGVSSIATPVARAPIAATGEQTQADVVARIVRAGKAAGVHMQGQKRETAADLYARRRREAGHGD